MAGREPTNNSSTDGRSWCHGVSCSECSLSCRPGAPAYACQQQWGQKNHWSASVQCGSLHFPHADHRNINKCYSWNLVAAPTKKIAVHLAKLQIYHTIYGPSCVEISSMAGGNRSGEWILVDRTSSRCKWCPPSSDRLCSPTMASLPRLGSYWWLAPNWSEDLRLQLIWSSLCLL